MLLFFTSKVALARGIVSGLTEYPVFAEVEVDAYTDLAVMRAVLARVNDVKPTAILWLYGTEDPGTAERDPDEAFRINAESVIHLAAAARKCGAQAVLYSTAEVFGQKGDGFTEDEVPEPASTWAESRRRGEELLLRALPKALVLRSGPVLSPTLELEARRLEGRVEAAEDERVSPIAASELGFATGAILAAGLTGVVHVATTEAAMTRAELWSAVAAAVGRSPDRVVTRPGAALDRGGVVWARSPTLLAPRLARVLPRPLRGVAPWLAELAANAPVLEPSPEVAPASAPAPAELAPSAAPAPAPARDGVFVDRPGLRARVLRLAAGARLGAAMDAGEVAHVGLGKVVVEGPGGDRIAGEGATFEGPVTRLTALDPAVLFVVGTGGAQP